MEKETCSVPVEIKKALFVYYIRAPRLIHFTIPHTIH